MVQHTSDNFDPAFLDLAIHEPDHRRTLFEEMNQATRTEVLSFQPVLELLGSAAGETHPPSSLKNRLKQIVCANSLVKKGPRPVVKARDTGWSPLPFEGIFFRILAQDVKRQSVTMLVRMDSGCGFPGHTHSGREETLVIEGDIYTDAFSLEKGDYHRAEPGSTHGDLMTKDGCVILITRHAGVHFNPKIQNTTH